MRLSSTTRGLVIGALIAVYAWRFKIHTSFTEMLLVAAGVQLAVLVARRLVPRDRMPQALYVIETIADGITVLLFALAVIGPIVHAGEAV